MHRSAASLPVPIATRGASATRFRSLRALLFLALASLGGASHAVADEIRVAVATNFRATMDALVDAFEATSAHTVVVSAGSTGSQYAQIRNGAPFDAFFAADAERPALLERAGIGVPNSRFVYAVGRLALWSARANYVDPAGRVLDAGEFRHLAIANPELAPYGAAARDVLRARNLWDTLQGRLVFGQDVGQTYSFVATGNAELGFVALAQLERPGAATGGSYWLVPASLHAPIEQQAILLRDTTAAREFMAFVKSDTARTIIASFGYAS